MVQEQAIALSVSEEQQRLEKLLQAVLQEAKQQGATAASVSASVTQGFSIQVRMGDIESLEFHRDNGVSVTTFFGQSKGSASSSDVRPDTVQEIVQAACGMAKVTHADKYAGLADKQEMAWEHTVPELFFPWDVTPPAAIEMALACEQKALDTDPRLTNSEGVNLHTQQSLSLYANSHGFVGTVPTSYHSLSCSLLATDEQGAKQRDYDYTTARCADDLWSWKTVAQRAAESTLQRLGAKPIKTTQVPVIFSAPIAGSLIRSFLAACNGGNLYRKASFLLDALGEQVFPSWMQIYQRPHLPRGLASMPYDGDGIATRDQHFVTDGVLSNYILSTYAARRLGMSSTANAGGVFNLMVSHGDKDLKALLADMGTGLLITELMGQGVNLVTGDYSRGAAGLWVEGGEIQFPVERVTIAGNLHDMFKQIAAVGNDTELRSNIQTGSILLENMMVAGQ